MNSPSDLEHGQPIPGGCCCSKLQHDPSLGAVDAEVPLKVTALFRASDVNAGNHLDYRSTSWQLMLREEQMGFFFF